MFSLCRAEIIKARQMNTRVATVIFGRENRCCVVLSLSELRVLGVLACTLGSYDALVLKCQLGEGGRMCRSKRKKCDVMLRKCVISVDR